MSSKIVYPREGLVLTLICVCEYREQGMMVRRVCTYNSYKLCRASSFFFVNSKLCVVDGQSDIVSLQVQTMICTGITLLQCIHAGIRVCTCMRACCACVAPYVVWFHSWIPFLESVEDAQQVLHRLFPVARGVFEVSLRTWQVRNLVSKLQHICN